MRKGIKERTHLKCLTWVTGKMEFVVTWDGKTTLVAQLVKRLPTMWERPGFDPWVRKIPWRRKWQPTPILLPEKSYGQGTLVGYSPWGHKKSDMTEWLHFHFHFEMGKTLDRTDWLGSGTVQFSSFQFSHSVVSDSLRPHESQHARPPCPSPTPRVHSDSRPSSPWCHPAISSSVVPFSSCPQSLPASGSFPMSQLFSWGVQSTGVSALASFLPKKSQGWSPSEWTGWISLQSKGPSRVFSNITVQKHQSSALSFLYSPTLTSTHDHRKNHSLD